MQKFKPQYRRLMFIDRRIKEGAYPNCAGLAAEWEVSDKTIQRDIEYLRDQLDAPVAYDAVRHGYYYTEPNFSLPAISISESDLFSVCVAQTVLSQFRNTPLFQKLSSVFEKIRDALPDKASINTAWMGERILVFPEPVTQVNAGTWDTLAKALRDNRRIAIRHVAAAGDRSRTVEERIVDPYFMVSHKGEWYLSTYCHLRKSIRTFAVSRITSVRIMDETFKLPAGLTAEKMFGDRMGIIWKDRYYRVRIYFSPEVAPFIRERQWHPAQVIKERRDGGLVLEFTTNHINEVKDWILSWGPGATVLSPGVLREKVISDVSRAAANYRA